MFTCVLGLSGFFVVWPCILHPRRSVARCRHDTWHDRARQQENRFAKCHEATHRSDTGFNDQSTMQLGSLPLRQFERTLLDQVTSSVKAWGRLLDHFLPAGFGAEKAPPVVGVYL